MCIHFYLGLRARESALRNDFVIIAQRFGFSIREELMANIIPPPHPPSAPGGGENLISSKGYRIRLIRTELFSSSLLASSILLLTDF